jgi:hypothetical protein
VLAPLQTRSPVNARQTFLPEDHRGYTWVALRNTTLGMLVGYLLVTATDGLDGVWEHALALVRQSCIYR